MGGYQLSLQAGSYNPAARLEASQKVSSSSTASSDGSSRRGRKSRSNSPVRGFGFFQSKRVASHQNLEGLMQPSPPRHSTACCDGLSERREVERRMSSQKMKVSAALVTQDSEDSHGDSFRSEDSESLALWEEKEPASTDHSWMKLSTQSPRWLGAMRRFGRSSPVHPKCSRDTPRVSLDRKPSQQSLHDASKSWYSNATKKIRNGESRSVRSPTGASNLLRQSGELLHPSKWDHECGITSGDSKHGSFSRLTEEDTRFTSSAVAWDISSRPESLVERARPENGLAWPIPADGLPEMAVREKFMDENSVKAKDVESVTDKLVVSSGSEEDLSCASNEEQCEAFFDGQSEYASCRTFAEDELQELESRHFKDRTSTPEDPAEFVNVIDFVAPLLSKPHSMEKDDATKSCERRVPFKWEALQGKQLRADEVAPATETPQPPSFETKDGFLSPFESLREQYIIKSKSAPLDGLYVIVPKAAQSGITKPRPPRAPTSTIKEDSVIPDLILTKSRSSNDAEGSLRRTLNSQDHRLFTKLRKSVFGSTRGPSPLGRKNDLGDFIDSSSPRSILRGPDDGSIPSSNPSLRSDPGTPAFSAIPTSSTSQSMSSCSASFDLNDSCEYETTYDLNSTAACIIVESRRVSLSFRDFGPARPSGEEMVVKVDDASESVISNIELLGCDDRFNANGLVSLPETMQSPELWTATFSARYEVCDSPRSDIPESPCAASERGSEFLEEFSSSRPVSRVTCGAPSEGQQQEVQVPIVIQKSKSRNGEFTARLGVMFSPLRLISSHESNHSCFVATTLSPPHEVDGEDRSPIYSGTTIEFLKTSELHSSSMKGRKAKSSWTHGERVKSKSSTRRHSSDDSQTMMVTISKAMKKILSKVTVKRSTSKGKSKLGSPVLDTLPPAGFHFTEVN
ncbi:hypothetical protein M758_9G124400 [Ceratodon purpureus]|nr:hypothetical protein M758_9G124400 [Ceratodon purpureus]